MGRRALLHPTAARLETGTGSGEIGLAGIPQRHLVEHAEGRGLLGPRHGRAETEAGQAGKRRPEEKVTKCPGQLTTTMPCRVQMRPVEVEPVTLQVQVSGALCVHAPDRCSVSPLTPVSWLSR